MGKPLLLIVVNAESATKPLVLIVADAISFIKPLLLVAAITELTLGHILIYVAPKPVLQSNDNPNTILLYMVPHINKNMVHHSITNGIKNI